MKANFAVLLILRCLSSCGIGFYSWFPDINFALLLKLPVQFVNWQACPLSYCAANYFTRLFGEGLEHAASLSKLMGETKAQQKDALKRRLQKIREHKAAGIEMTTEEAQLLEDGNEEETIEEEVTTGDVLNDLQVIRICSKILITIQRTSEEAYN